jgi:hypothetical protein
LENVRVNTIILKWIFKGTDWADVYWLFPAQDEDKGEGSFEDVCEPSGEIMWGAFFDYVGNRF